MHAKRKGKKRVQPKQGQNVTGNYSSFPTSSRTKYYFFFVDKTALRTSEMNASVFFVWNVCVPFADVVYVNYLEMMKMLL